jgi:hypothetical protein
MDIPEEIQNRIEWIYEDSPIPRIRSIKPYAPCSDCGITVEKIRICRFSSSRTPYDHIREHCNICQRYRHPAGNNTWYKNGAELTRFMYSENVKNHSCLNKSGK